MLRAQILDNGRIQFRRDPVGPAADFPEIARGEEIDVEWQLGVGARGRADAFRGPLQMVDGVLDLLANVLALEDLVEVLDAEIAARAEGIRRIVCPGVAVDAPARAVPFALQPLFERESANQDNLASRFAQSGDARSGEPTVDVSGVVVSHDATELGVGGVTGTFPFDGHDDRLARVLFQECKDVVHHGSKVLGAAQRDGKDAVNENELIIASVKRTVRLDPNVKKAHPLLQLLRNRRHLATNRRQSAMVGRGIVSTWDGKGG